jgi:hypothetical protein
MGCKFTETNCDPGVFDEVLQLVAEGSSDEELVLSKQGCYE